MKTEYLITLPAEWQPVAAVFAALGDETRQKMLLLFEPGEELSIKEIVAAFGQSRTTIVHHLTTLTRSGVLSFRRKGKLALYKLEYTTVQQALHNVLAYIENETASAPAETHNEEDHEHQTIR